MPTPLQNKCVVLGITGSIACYKSVDLASKLTQAGMLVEVIMTRGASKFVSPLSFSSITRSTVVTDMFDPQTELGIDHVSLAERADVLVVAPATAHTISKLSWGLADDALTTTALATQSPVIVCPAMDGHMFENAVTQENLGRLQSRGYIIAGPTEGRLASGMVGIGRMLEPLDILGHVCQVLGGNGDLAGRKIVVSAGGTREPIDSVRYVSNYSSGKMGYAIAEAARDRGATVALVAAPNSLPDLVGIQHVNVVTAKEMNDAIRVSCQDADALVMGAAVSDWRPESEATHKLKKGENKHWTLELIRTPDILANVKGKNIVKVGFAAETEDLKSNALIKLERKGLDIIAANNIRSEDSGFGSDTNRILLLDSNGGSEQLDLMSKYDVGHRILDRVSTILSGR